MRIEFDYDFDGSGHVIASHFIETTSGSYPKFLVAALGATPVDVIQVIKGLHLATVPIVGTGWDVITKHPTYPGQTRLQALVAEIVRLNDAPSRAILGV